MALENVSSSTTVGEIDRAIEILKKVKSNSKTAQEQELVNKRMQKFTYAKNKLLNVAKSAVGRVNSENQKIALARLLKNQNAISLDEVNKILEESNLTVANPEMLDNAPNDSLGMKILEGRTGVDYMTVVKTTLATSGVALLAKWGAFSAVKAGLGALFAFNPVIGVCAVVLGSATIIKYARQLFQPEIKKIIARQRVKQNIEMAENEIPEQTADIDEFVKKYANKKIKEEPIKRTSGKTTHKGSEKSETTSDKPENNEPEQNSENSETTPDKYEENLNKSKEIIKECEDSKDLLKEIIWDIEDKTKLINEADENGNPTHSSEEIQGFKESIKFDYNSSLNAVVKARNKAFSLDGIIAGYKKYKEDETQNNINKAKEIAKNCKEMGEEIKKAYEKAIPENERDIANKEEDKQVEDKEATETPTQGAEQVAEQTQPAPAEPVAEQTQPAPAEPAPAEETAEKKSAREIFKENENEKIYSDFVKVYKECVNAMVEDKNINRQGPSLLIEFTSIKAALIQKKQNSNHFSPIEYFNKKTQSMIKNIPEEQKAKYFELFGTASELFGEFEKVLQKEELNNENGKLTNQQKTNRKAAIANEMAKAGFKDEKEIENLIGTLGAENGK